MTKESEVLRVIVRVGEREQEVEVRGILSHAARLEIIRLMIKGESND